MDTLLGRIGAALVVLAGLSLGLAAPTGAAPASAGPAWESARAEP